MDPKPKLSSLSPETLQKLLEIEKRSPANQQLQVLSDIAIMVQELISVADETKADTAEQMKALGAVLTDAREQLVAINGKETPESPDYAKPVVEAISRLEAAIGKIDVKPKVNIEKPDAPVVNVEAPNVDVVVDTKEIARMLKEDIPSAFREAIASIPEVSYPEIPDRWDEVIEWLQSIDTASRMKPQGPNKVVVVNEDGSPVGSSGGLTDTELRASPVEVTGTVSTTAPVGGATEEEQLSQTDVLLELVAAMKTVAAAKGIASDLRVTLLGGTAAVTGTLTGVTTVTGLTNIGGLPAVTVPHNIQNQSAVQSNINNVIVS